MFLTESIGDILFGGAISIIGMFLEVIVSIVTLFLTIAFLFYVGLPLAMILIAILVTKRKSSTKPLSLKFNKKQILLISIIIATIAGFTLAYIKGEPCSRLSRAFKGAISAVSGHHYSKCYYQFNYIAGILAFITSGGLTFLILNMKYKKDTIENT